MPGMHKNKISLNVLRWQQDLGGIILSKKTLTAEQQTKILIESTVSATIEKISKLSSIDRMKEIKDETFKNTEKLLYRYKTLKEHVTDEKEYFDMLYKRSSGSIVRYSKTKATQNTDEMLRLREESLDRSKNDIDRLEKAIEKIKSKKEFQVIQLRYFETNENDETRTFEEIASILGIDEKTARTWKNKMINEIAVRLFGSDAI